jgi:hypothetical protein
MTAILKKISVRKNSVAGLHTFGTPVDEFADAIFKGLEAGKSKLVRHVLKRR